MDSSDFWVLVGTAAPVIGLAHAVLIGSFWRQSDAALKDFLKQKDKPVDVATAKQTIEKYNRAFSRARASARAEWGVAVSFGACNVAFVTSLVVLAGRASALIWFGAVVIVIPFLGLLWPQILELVAMRAERSRYYSQLGDRKALVEALDEARSAQGSR